MTPGAASRAVPAASDADTQAAGLGDCIDCDLCVQVCPTGIDIRDGLQYECIGCALCIDACNSVMRKMGYEPGLVRYTSERELEGGKTHWLRPGSSATSSCSRSWFPCSLTTWPHASPSS
jgi:polyferredoxin